MQLAVDTTFDPFSTLRNVFDILLNIEQTHASQTLLFIIHFTQICLFDQNIRKPVQIAACLRTNRTKEASPYESLYEIEYTYIAFKCGQQNQ